MLDEYTGLYSDSKGGTEFSYESLKNRIDPKIFDKFQIICSRPRKFLNKPRILWATDYVADPETEVLKDKKFRENFNKIVFVSNAQQLSYNLLRGIEYSESVVIKNAIVPIEKHEKPKGCINLIYHTTPHRGLEILVPCFIELCKHHKDKNIHLHVYSSFDLYGWKDRDKPYQKLFDLCKIHPKITYHGYQPNNVIREALKQAHIFAYPNIWPETSSISTIEAMSAGCLVISPNHAALFETVGNDGLIYNYHENVHAHAKNFIQILHGVLESFNTGQFDNHMKMCSVNASRVYSWDNIIPQWNNLFSELLNNENNKKY